MNFSWEKKHVAFIVIFFLLKKCEHHEQSLSWMMNVQRYPRTISHVYTRKWWQSRDAIELPLHLAFFFLTDWNERECNIIADVNACACACLLVAWNRQNSSLQDSEYSKENANTAWKFGQEESHVSIRVCAYVYVHAHLGTGIPHICLYSTVGCLWGNCGVFGEIRDASPRFPPPTPSPLRSPSLSPIKVPIRRLMFQVGWVKADTKAIQAIHDHVITHNQRVSVSHSDHSIWNLHIKGVQKEDGGLYMCQINTDPMKSQVYIALNSFKLIQSDI